MIEEPVQVSPVGRAKKAGFEHNILFVAEGGGVTFGGKMVLSVVRLVTAIILARLLGADQYGLYRLTLSVANIAVVLAVFGLDTALLRYIAIQVGRGDERGVWGTLQIGLGLTTLLSVLTGTLLYAFAFQIADHLFGEPRIVFLLKIASLIIPFLTLSEVLVWALRGFRRMDRPAIAQFVAQPIVRLLLVLGLLWTDFDAVLAIITFGLADLAASLLLLYYLNQEFSLIRSFRQASHELREILNFSIPVWLSEMMFKFQGNLQTLLIGSLGTVVGVGIFSVANQISLVSGEFSSSLNISAKPVIAELYDRGDLKQLGRIYQATNKWVVMFQMPVFLIMVLFPAALLSIFGESFTDGAAALVVLAVAGLIRVGTGMGGIIIDMTGHTRLKLVNSIVRLVVYIGFNLLLIPRWGVMGAAAAILIGEGVINLVRLGQVYYLFRLIPYNFSFYKPLLAAAVTTASAIFFGRILPPDLNLINTLANIAFLVGLYGILILLLGFSEQERQMMAVMTRRLRAKIWRK